MVSLTNQDIAIGIPVFKKKLTKNEIRVLTQANNVLAIYPCYFIAPSTIDKDYYLQFIPRAQFICFSESYFKNTITYSKLMTSALLYKAFSKYQYMLIYQTDAYVFRDELLEWANKGYDYIGAPWIVRPPQIKQRVWFDMNRFTEEKVGNGGFCLRKIKSHIHIAQKWGWVQNLLRKNEDFFWSVFAPLMNKDFKIPSAVEAISFSFELAPSKAYEMNGKKLPFGCHAWQKYEPTFWSDFIPFEK